LGRQVLLVPSSGMNGLELEADTKARCDRAFELWRSGRYDLILVTGGVTQSLELPPDSTIMKSYLVSIGAPSSLIIEENRALDTFQNVAFSLEKLDKEGIKDFQITVVTQWQHGIRFLITFWLGHRIHIRIKFARYPMSAIYWCCECLYIIYHLYDPRGDRFLARLNRRNRELNTRIVD